MNDEAIYAELLAEGKCDEVDIDDFIELWHEMPQTRPRAHLPLHEFLGLTQEEYALFISWGAPTGKLKEAVTRRFKMETIPVSSADYEMLMAFKDEVCLKYSGNEILEDMHWSHLSTGFFLAKGADPEKASELSSIARYKLGYWQEEVDD